MDIQEFMEEVLKKFVPNITDRIFLTIENDRMSLNLGVMTITGAGLKLLQQWQFLTKSRTGTRTLQHLRPDPICQRY